MTVRVDAGPVIGGGHLMRCLTLANALKERGAGVTFVAVAIPDALADKIIAQGHKLVRIPPPAPTEHQEYRQDVDVRATAAVAGAADWLIVDHYLLDAQWHSAARSFARRILVIDDLANREYDCDVLLDQNFGRSALDYGGLVTPNTRILAGAEYALLRPEFARERPAALRRRDMSSVERILISLGTTDPDGLVARVAGVVLAAAPECAVDVVVSRQASSLPLLETMASSNHRIRLHVDSDLMAELMRDADIAIGASGATNWERCCLGLPTIALVLAGNQQAAADALDRAGAVKVVGLEDLRAALRDWLADDVKRQQASQSAAAICDGQGTSRVLAACKFFENEPG